MTHWDNGRITPQGSLSISRTFGETEMSFGLEGTLQGRRLMRNEVLYTGSGTLLEQRSESDQRDYWEVNPTLSVSSTLADGSSLRFDSRGWYWEWHRQNSSYADGPPPGGGAFQPIRFERSETYNFGQGGRGSLTWRETGRIMSRPKRPVLFLWPMGGWSRAFRSLRSRRFR